jgi:hypothetical protein
MPFAMWSFLAIDSLTLSADTLWNWESGFATDTMKHCTRPWKFLSVVGDDLLRQPSFVPTEIVNHR